MKSVNVPERLKDLIGLYPVRDGYVFSFFIGLLRYTSQAFETQGAAFDAMAENRVDFQIR